MEKMQKIRQSFDQSDLPFAKCFLVSDEDGVLVMENLKKRGYKTVPKSAEGILSFSMRYNVLIELKLNKAHLIFLIFLSCRKLRNTRSSFD